jgi:uncharacterized protein YciI
MRRAAVVISAAPSPDRKVANKLYVISFDPTDTAGDRHALRAEHFAYVAELERRGVLFAAGPFINEAGQPQGGGMFIVRAASPDEAGAIAGAEPYCANGFRRFRVQAWRLSEGTAAGAVGKTRDR